MRAADLGLTDIELPVGPVPKRYTIEYLTNPKEIEDLLYRTQELTDDAYAALVDDVGGRAARLILRAKALGGDIRALDLYLKIVREDQERRRQHKTPMRQLHASSFDQSGRPDRPTTTVVDATDATVDPTTTIVESAAD